MLNTLKSISRKDAHAALLITSMPEVWMVYEHGYVTTSIVILGVITHPNPNLTGGVSKPQMKLWHAWLNTSDTYDIIMILLIRAPNPMSF